MHAMHAMQNVRYDSHTAANCIFSLTNVSPGSNSSFGSQVDYFAVKITVALYVYHRNYQITRCALNRSLPSQPIGLLEAWGAQMRQMSVRLKNTKVAKPTSQTPNEPRLKVINLLRLCPLSFYCEVKKTVSKLTALMYPCWKVLYRRNLM